MLLLSFHIGTEQYAVAAKQIIEILPLTHLQALPMTPDFVGGLLDFRGRPVPVIDLCQLIVKRPCNKVLSSRIVLVNYNASNSSKHPLGLIAEKVTRSVTRPCSMRTAPISIARSPPSGDKPVVSKSSTITVSAVLLLVLIIFWNIWVR